MNVDNNACEQFNSIINKLISTLPESGYIFHSVIHIMLRVEAALVAYNKFIWSIHEKNS